MPTRFLRIISHPFSLIIAFVLMLLMRVIYLDSDPSFLMENAFVTDEGWWAHNPRNAVLFGKWIMDDFNVSLYLTPLFSIFEYFVFKILGVSLVSARLVSAITGLLTIIIFYLLLRRVWDKEKSALATLFFGFSNIHIMHSRVALVEATLVMFLILTIYLWEKGNDNRVWSFFSGLFFGLTFLVKLTAIYFVPIFFALWTIEHIRKEFSLGKFMLFISGVALVGLPYLVLFVIPHRNEWRLMLLAAATPNVFNPFYVAKFPFNNIFILTPILTSMSMLYLFGFFSGLTKKWRNTIQGIDHLEVIALSILIGNASLLAISSVQPDRRYLPFLIALAILGAKVLSNPWNYLDNKWDNGRSRAILLMVILMPLWIYSGYMFLVIGKTLPIGNLVYPSIYIHNIFKMIFHFFRMNIAEKPGITYLLILFIIFFIVLNILLKTARIQLITLCKQIIYWGTVLFFLAETGQYLTWLINPTFTVREADREISNYVGTEPVVLRASTLAIDTHAPLIVPHRKGINANVFSRFKAKFALTALVINGQRVDPDFVNFRTKKRENEEKLPHGSIQIKKFYLCPFRDSYRYVFCLWQLPT